MFIFRHGGRYAASTGRSVATKRYASKISIPFAPPPFPVIESCPSPTCGCRDAPAGLDIEREQNINGSVATYAEQILISTGRDDWKSKIEDDEEAVLVRQLKKYLTRGGKYADPYYNVMITNSSFRPSTKASPPDGSRALASDTAASPSPRVASTDTAPSASAYLLPSFRYIPTIPTDDTSIESFIKAFILPEKLHDSYSSLPPEQRANLLRQPQHQHHFKSLPVNDVLVLVCGHGNRDERCGKLSRVLIPEFEEKLRAQNIALGDVPGTGQEDGMTAKVASISHIGGHKWAGNVIIYIPPKYEGHALAGKGIWYGRVGPEHVEGIVRETVVGGKVIRELFRGGVAKGGEVLRL